MNEELPFCECGCGERVSKVGNRFIHGHNMLSIEARKVQSERTLEQWQDPDFQKMRSDAAKKQWADSDNRKDQSDRRIQHFIDNPEAGSEHSRRLIQLYKEHPEIGEAHSEWLIQWNKEHPEWGANHGEFLKEYFKNNPEEIEKSSARSQGIPYKDWTGFSMPHDMSKIIYLNARYPGCVRHHLTKTIVACIPKELHDHIAHCFKTGYNMGEMNMLALQFINGCYDD